MIKQFEVFQLEKWLHQNKAILDDLIEGTLNDDSYYCGKRGFIAVIWQFETTWTSKAIAFFCAVQKSGSLQETLGNVGRAARRCGMYPGLNHKKCGCIPALDTPTTEKRKPNDYYRKKVK